MKSTPADVAADAVSDALTETDSAAVPYAAAVPPAAPVPGAEVLPAVETVPAVEALPDAEAVPGADVLPGAARDGGPAAGDRAPALVWALPDGPGCAAHARRLLRDALASLGAAPDAIADAQLMVSELATNAHQHAGEHGPHELWLYRGEGRAREVRCAVFDAFADAALPCYSWTSGDCGRGLGIVRELSGGRWGLRRTLSRLGPPVRGKAVWFAVPGVPPGRQSGR